MADYRIVDFRAFADVEVDPAVERYFKALIQLEDLAVEAGFDTDDIVKQRQPSSGPKGSTMARSRYQKGSLRFVNKKWFGQYREDFVDSSGQVQRKLRKVLLGTHAELPTRKLAQRRLDLALARINSATYRPGRVSTFSEFIEQWRSQVLILAKPSTRKAAESHLRCYLVPRWGRLRLDEIGQQNVQHLVSGLAKRVSRHTLLNILGTLGSILRVARSWGYTTGEINRDALVLPTYKLGRKVRFFSAAEVVSIVETAQEEPYRTMFILAALTGLRAGEVLGLQVGDIDLDRKTLTVRQSAWYGTLQTTKSKSANRSVPMPEVLCAVLANYLKRHWKGNDANLLFATRSGKPHSANKIVQRKLWPILDKLQIPRCGWHAFRHAASTLLIDLGASPVTVQAQLGHSDPRITLNAYSHRIEKSQREAVEKLAGILMPSDAQVEANGR